MHRDVHHRGGAHALQGEEMILRLGKAQHPLIPGHDQRRVRALGLPRSIGPRSPDGVSARGHHSRETRHERDAPPDRHRHLLRLDPTNPDPPAPLRNL